MESEVNRPAFGERRYVMKKHHATRLHYDLRLEWNGVLLSWALPEGPSNHAGVIREAIEVKDHDRENLLFEGVDATGPIMLWDRGTWAPHPESGDIANSLHKGTLQFTLRGERLKGGWTLTRTDRVTNMQLPIWTLCKQADSFAASRDDKCVLEKWPNSVSTGRTMEEIVHDWAERKDKHERQRKLFDET